MNNKLPDAKTIFERKTFVTHYIELDTIKTKFVQMWLVLFNCREDFYSYPQLWHKMTATDLSLFWRDGGPEKSLWVRRISLSTSHLETLAVFLGKSTAWQTLNQTEIHLRWLQTCGEGHTQKYTSRITKKNPLIVCKNNQLIYDIISWRRSETKKADDADKPRKNLFLKLFWLWKEPFVSWHRQSRLFEGGVLGDDFIHR